MAAPVAALAGKACHEPPVKRARLSGDCSSLDAVLLDADAALHLSARACAVATHLCARSSDAAERMLSLAEAALAATMQQLAAAQDLVASQLMATAQQHQKQQQALAGGGNGAGAGAVLTTTPCKTVFFSPQKLPAIADPDLEDTGCSSSLSGTTSFVCAAAK